MTDAVAVTATIRPRIGVYRRGRPKWPLTCGDRWITGRWLKSGIPSASQTRRLCSGGRRVLVVAEVGAPLGGAFGDGDVSHEVVGRGSVPVLLAAGDANHVTGTDGEERSTARLDVADAFGQ